MSDPNEPHDQDAGGEAPPADAGTAAAAAATEEARHDAAPADSASSTMAHVMRRGIPLVVLALVLAGGYLFWQTIESGPDHEAAPTPQAPVEVTVMTVEPETIAMPLRFLGQTEGSMVVEIRARVAGYLDKRSFKEGDRVEQGQELFKIDSRPFEVALAHATARLASAEATLERARQQVGRYTELAARQSATAGELEEWQTQERVAAAMVAQAKAEIAAAQLELDYTTIEAPITGKIGRALKEAGSYVDSGQNGLLAVMQRVDPIYVRYSVTEQEMLRFRHQAEAGQIIVPEVGQLELEITLADGSVYPHRGRINFVDVQVDETTGTSVVRGEVANPQDILKPGQFIYSTVLGIDRVNVLRVPQRAVRLSPSGASVLVIDDEGVAESRPVELGEWSGDDFWIIERGLAPGDRVIIDRLLMVRAGMKVIAREAVGPGEALERAAADASGGGA